MRQEAMRAEQVIPHHFGDPYTGAQRAAISPLMIDPPLKSTQSWLMLRGGIFDKFINGLLPQTLEFVWIILRNCSHRIKIKLTETFLFHQDSP
jgi:hypothetical protein